MAQAYSMRFRSISVPRAPKVGKLDSIYLTTVNLDIDLQAIFCSWDMGVPPGGFVGEIGDPR